MRLFVACDLPDHVKQLIARTVLPLHERMQGFSWTTRDQWHITLAFLGEVEDEKVDTLCARLEEVRSPFCDVEVGGFGVFPSWEAPRVFWVGVSLPKHLVALSESVWAVLEREGFVRDPKPFHPHITLARIKRISPSEKKSLQSLQMVSQAIRIGEFHLYKSELSPKGARYTKIASFVLGDEKNG